MASNDPWQKLNKDWKIFDFGGCLWHVWVSHSSTSEKIPPKKHAEKKTYFYLGFINDSRPIKSWNLFKTHKIHLLRPGQPLPTTPFKKPSASSTTKKPNFHGKWMDFSLIPGRSWNKLFPLDGLSSSIPNHKNASQKKDTEISLSKMLKAVSCWDPLQMALWKKKTSGGWSGSRNFHKT